MTRPLQDFGRVMGRLLRFARRASYTVIGFTAYLFAVHIWQAFQVLAEVHIALAWLFVAAVALAFAWLIGRPVARFLSMPPTLRPPELPPKEEREPKDLVRHLAFLECYLESLGRNPAWDGSRDELEFTLVACRELRAEARAAGTERLEELGKRVFDLEHGAVARALAPLDAQVNALIRKEALGVGIATALSWNGMVDAFVVLWRNLNLATRIACIYHGRPGVRGTLSILRDVSAATVAGAYLQDLTDVAASGIGALFGKTVGVVAAPVLDGSLNAVATLRIGYVAKARCRALQKWTERTALEAVTQALTDAGALTKGIVTEVVKTVGGGLMNLPGRALDTIRESLSELWRRMGGDDTEAGGPAAGGPAAAGGA